MKEAPSILILEPYYGGSHKYWLDNLQKFSSCKIHSLTLPARKWKWRMQGAAYTFAQQIKEKNLKPELIIASDMMDLSLLMTLLKDFISVPYVYYMHENQLTYPLSSLSEKKYDLSYGYINYKSCLAADAVVFNSSFHKNQFLDACKSLLNKMPDFKNLDSIEKISSKSEVIGLGLDLKEIDHFLNNTPENYSDSPTVLWNHRWEHDKSPQIFVKLLEDLKSDELEFDIIITGVVDQKSNLQLSKFKKTFENHTKFFGYANDYNHYISLLRHSDILPVTSKHDFFGLSVMEAIYCGCSPILPQNMVYEEHFFDTQRFYNTYEELFAKAKHFISNFDRKNKTDKQDLQKYDWRNQVILYDSFFHSMIDEC